MSTIRYSMQLLFVFLTFCVSIFFPHTTHSQESLTLSVTPPLFQMNVVPGQDLRTLVKVINSNPQPLTVYAQVFNFEPQGEGGEGMFTPPNPEGELKGTILADWITLDSAPIIAPPEQSLEIPVRIQVPNDASPGGHFAAILIGTRPPDIEGEASLVRTSQVVTSLFFVRVAGDVVEDGSIREFSVEHMLRERPEATFALRFENRGNVHLQPQGGITIYNMWGKERGYIPINQKSHFGNVLPESIRKFDFSWRGEASLADIGRYMAEVVLVYGDDGRKTVDRKVYFYVVPLKGTLITLCVLGAFIFFIIWIVRRYVRRAMHLAGYEPHEVAERETYEQPQKRHTLSMREYSAPLKEGVLDLRTRIVDDEGDNTTSLISRIFDFVRQYALFFVGLLCVVFFIGISMWYLGDVLKSEKEYEVTVERGDVDVTLTDEDIKEGTTIPLPTE